MRSYPPQHQPSSAPTLLEPPEPISFPLSRTVLGRIVEYDRVWSGLLEEGILYTMNEYATTIVPFLIRGSATSDILSFFFPPDLSITPSQDCQWLVPLSSLNPEGKTQ